MQAELHRLAVLVDEWSQTDEIPAVERDLALEKLRNLYEALRFADDASAVSADTAAGEAEEVLPESIDLGEVLSLDELPDPGETVDFVSEEPASLYPSGDVMPEAAAEPEVVEAPAAPKSEPETPAIPETPETTPEPVAESSVASATPEPAPEEPASSAMPEAALESEPETSAIPETPEVTPEPAPEEPAASAMPEAALEPEPETPVIPETPEVTPEPVAESSVASVTPEPASEEPAASVMPEAALEPEPETPVIPETPEVTLEPASEEPAASAMPEAAPEPEPETTTIPTSVPDSAPVETPEPAPAKSHHSSPTLFGLEDEETLRHRHKQRVIMSLYGPSPEPGRVSEPARRSDLKQTVTRTPAGSVTVSQPDEISVRTSGSQGTPEPAKTFAATSATTDSGAMADLHETPEETTPFEILDVPALSGESEAPDDSVESLIPEMPGASEKPEILEEKASSPLASKGPAAAEPLPTGGAVLGEVINHDVQTLADTIAPPRDIASELRRSEPVTDLRRAIGLNDRFLLIRDLFGGDGEAFERAIEILNGFEDLDDCMIFIAEHYAWNPNSDGAKLLMELLERKFA